MNGLKSLWWLGAVAALAACNPWEDTKGGTPTILEVMASGGSTNDSATSEVTAVDCAVTPRPAECPAEVEARWLVRAQSSCAVTGGTQAAAADQFIVITKVNKLLDGFSIEQTPQTCVPQGVTATTEDASWVKVTPFTGATPGDAAATATETRHWYSCYSPGSPTATEGAAVVFYRTTAVRDYSTTPPTVPGDLQATRRSWFALGSGLPAAVNDRTTYRITGAAKDKGGVELPIDVELRVEPNAGAAAFAVTSVGGTTDAPTLALDVTKGACTNAAATYTIEQLVGTDETLDTSWVDTGLTVSGGPVTVTQDVGTPGPLQYGKAYTYRLREHITGGTTGEQFVRTAFDADGAPTQFTQALLFAPTTAPTLTAVNPTTVTVEWAAVSGATSYIVQRANVGEPFIDVATVDAGTGAGPFTYQATGLDPGTGYQFRIVAANANGQSLPGPDATVTTPT